MIKKLLQRLIKFAAYTAAAIVILLAIAVGLFRLFLPRLPEYQEDIKAWASTAIGMEVQFSGMDARWGLSGPEVKFYNAELLSVLRPAQPLSQRGRGRRRHRLVAHRQRPQSSRRSRHRAPIARSKFASSKMGNGGSRAVRRRSCLPARPQQRGRRPGRTYTTWLAKT